ncbi:hypothetical protein H4R20_000154 [Coemansia guatemalensis]|uniref:Uncharacterized protein n=1 Tax=Coemansia guatemalensis TaxID=2761395 RepID=A0A9W8HZN3_9FUNG|nr:hypothetical protein H4R20_000154 [Coemansia guatemalensis]
MTDIQSKKTTTSAFVESLSEAVVMQLQKLKEIGFSNIFVTNLPPLQITPLIALQKRRELANNIVDTYNKMLSAKTDKWAKESGVKAFGLLDINGFVQVALQHNVSNALGLSDTNNSCIGGNLLELLTEPNHAKAILNVILDMKNSVVCTEPSSYFSGTQSILLNECIVCLATMQANS